MNGRCFKVILRVVGDMGVVVGMEFKVLVTSMRMRMPLQEHLSPGLNFAWSLSIVIFASGFLLFWLFFVNPVCLTLPGWIGIF